MLTATRRARRLALLLLTLVSCGPPPGDPREPVLRSFDAFLRGDASAVQSGLDPQAVRIAADACEKGLAISCQRRNYGSFRRLKSREASVTGRSSFLDEETTAAVQLRTVWRDFDSLVLPLPGDRLSGPGEEILCQAFTVSYAGRGRWRVRHFDFPRRCQ